MARFSCPIAKVLLLAWRWSAGVDDDLGGVAAVGIVGGHGIEGGAAGAEETAAADHDLGRRVVVNSVEGHRVAGGEGQGAVVGKGHRHVIRSRSDQDRDVGPHGQGRPLIHGEVAGEDVKQVGGVLRADGVQGHALAAGESVRLDVDVLETQVVVGGAGQVLHVDGGDIQGQVEGVADQVAGVEDGADGQVQLPDREGTVVGLEVSAGVDDDLGGVAAVGIVGGRGIEGGAAGVEETAAADHDLRRRVVVNSVEGHRVAGGEGQGAVVGKRHCHVISPRPDQHAGARSDRQRRPRVHGHVLAESGSRRSSRQGKRPARHD